MISEQIINQLYGGKMLSNFRRRLGVIAAVSVLAALVPVLASSTASAAPAAIAISTKAALDAEAT